MFFTPWIKRLRQIIARVEYRSSSTNLMMLAIHYEAELKAIREGWSFEKLPYEHKAWSMM